MRHRLLAVVAVLWPVGAIAQTQGPVVTLDAIEVVPMSPLAAPDTGVAREKYPTSATTLNGADLAAAHQAGLAQALDRRAPGVATAMLTKREGACANGR